MTHDLHMTDHCWENFQNRKQTNKTRTLKKSKVSSKALTIQNTPGKAKMAIW